MPVDQLSREKPFASAARADFPVLRREVDGLPITYLDSAATSLKPMPVVDAVTRYYTEVGANIHRGRHILSDEASEAYEQARIDVAEFVGATTAGTVFTANTTHAVNLLAAGLKLSDTPQILVSGDAHHSLQLPWRQRGRVRPIRVGDDGCLDLDHYQQLLHDRPDLVAISHCSNVTGRYVPARLMTDLARAAGALVVVDAAQSVPHRPHEVTAIGADATVFSGHKMLGPTGIGVLVLSPELAARLETPFPGGGTVDWVSFDEVRPRRAPHRFEAGTPHVAGAFGMAAAVAYLDCFGLAEVERHDRWMADVLYAEAVKRPYLRVVGAGPGDRAGIISLAVDGCPDLGGLAQILSDSYGVMCRTGHMCAQPLVDQIAGGQVLRMSTYVYNTGDEVGRAFAALDEALPRVRA